ncbi:MAG: rRNA maturation RNase YbeY [Legionellales bacterium]|nr:rRNA maturation RNase YbeY [Legionellales bacterium]
MNTDAYTIAIQVACEPEDPVPAHDHLQYCAHHVLASLTPRADICLRIVTPLESQQLNTVHRHQTKPTNVLSFCYHDDVATQLEGDLVLCAQIICHEAQLQQKSLDAHWAHLIIHGILHLAGFDHELEQDAQRMEQQEIKLLAQLGFPNPYE